MAESFLPSVRAEIGGGDAVERAGILLTLADVVGKPEVLRNGDEASGTLFWARYHEVLGHIPNAVLNRACNAFLAIPPQKGRAKWFPEPGILLDLAKQDEPWRDACRLARGLDRIAKAPKRRAREPLTPEQEAEYEARNAELMAKFRNGVKAERDAQAEEAKGALDWLKNPRPWQQQATT